MIDFLTVCSYNIKRQEMLIFFNVKIVSSIFCQEFNFKNNAGSYLIFQNVDHKLAFSLFFCKNIFCPLGIKPVTSEFA